MADVLEMCNHWPVLDVAKGVTLIDEGVRTDRLFVVDNGNDSAIYLFKSSDANATVSANELTLLATLDGTASTSVSDYAFAV